MVRGTAIRRGGGGGIKASLALSSTPVVKLKLLDFKSCFQHENHKIETSMYFSQILMG